MSIHKKVNEQFMRTGVNFFDMQNENEPIDKMTLSLCILCKNICIYFKFFEFLIPEYFSDLNNRKNYYKTLIIIGTECYMVKVKF